MGEPITTTSDAAAVWDMHAERWRKTIRAKNLSKNTERGYLETAHRWSRWLAAEGHDIEPDDAESWHIEDFIADIITTTSPGNAAFHYRNLRVYFGWLKKRKAITGSNPFEETEPPNVPDKVTPVLADEEHAAVLATCGGKSFLDLRDTAIILLFIDTGMRVSELASIKLADVDLTTHTIQIRGKGNKIRTVRFGNSAGLALARYRKARAKQPAADLPDLWLSSRRDIPLRADGIKGMLSRRGQQAGLSYPLHAHRFRHDFSDRWQAAGGSENGLMMIAGWSSTKMPRHYGKAAAERRALAEHARVSPADALTG